MKSKKRWICAMILGVFFFALLSGKRSLAKGSLKLKVMAVSLHEVKLSWNQPDGVKKYKIFRTECSVDNGITPGEDKKSTKKQIADLSGKKKVFSDKTVRSGKCYHYQIKAVTKNGTLSTGKIVHIAVQNTHWGDMEDLADPVSPSSIHLRIHFNLNPWPRLEPDGIVIYRGTTWDTVKKLKVISLHKKGNGASHPTEEYTDTSVKPGKTYYYKVRPYVKDKGKKVFGIGTDYLKLSAILPAGKYSSNTLLKDSGKMIEFSLIGQNKGNAEINFIENQFNGLTELICRKSDETYDTVSLKLKSYQIGKTKWKTFKGQEIKLKGKEKITFRFVPYAEDEIIPQSFEEYETVEILFRLQYEDSEREIHADGKNGSVMLTGIGNTTAAKYYGKEFSPTIYKKNKKAKKVAEAFLTGMFQSGYANLDTGITVSYVDDENGTDQLSKRILPDGVRIYRSTDNKNFQVIADLFYKKGETKLEFEDSGVWPGKTYYYKARNFTTSKKGKVFSAAMKSSLPFYAQYCSGLYDFRHLNPVEWKMTGQDLSTIQIFKIQGLSYGNPTFYLNASKETYAVAHEKTEDYNAVLDEKIIEYSFDGTIWNKIPKSGKNLLLLPKQTVYLKLELDNGDDPLEKYDIVKNFCICLPMKDGGQETVEWRYLVEDRTFSVSMLTEDYD